MTEESVGDLVTPPAATGPRSASTEFPGTPRNKASSPVSLSEDSATRVIHHGADWQEPSLQVAVPAGR